MVLVFGAPVSDTTLADHVETARQAGGVVTAVLSGAAQPPTGTALVYIPVTRTSGARSRLSRTLGALTSGRAAWTASRQAWRRPEVRAALTGADVAVAADPAAVPLVWLARAVTHTTALVNGVPPALHLIRELVGDYPDARAGRA